MPIAEMLNSVFVADGRNSSLMDIIFLMPIGIDRE